jgi:ubiquinone/menaquinone biosynthesis C-methylase UbiE
MSTTQQLQGVAAPFDAVADRYDETFSSSTIGRAQRGAVWRQLEKTFRSGDHILEIGCGTGVDACFLAERGVTVLACDSSPQMIDAAARRVRQNGLQALVKTRVLRGEDISTLPPDDLFDGAFSNFGALNCVDDVERVAHSLARVLKPGATAVLCWMGPRCVWEMIWYLAHADKDKAFRRFKPEGVNARIADGAFIQVHYPSVRFLARRFAPEFRLKGARGIGVVVPPSYVEPWAGRHPRLLQVCEQVDSWLGGCPGVRLLGDHVLVRLQREQTAVSGV